METITIHECLFNVVVERDQSLVPYPVHFLYYKNQRVGLYVVAGDMDSIYFDSVTMFELFGQEFNKDNFLLASHSGDSTRRDSRLTNTINSRMKRTFCWQGGTIYFKSFHLKSIIERII